MSRYRGFPPAERTAIVAALLERDGSICGICQGGPLDATITEDRDPAQVTIDHIEPLGSRGDVGAYDRLANLQLAHAVCNRLRAKFPDRPPKWYRRQFELAVADWPKPSNRERKAAKKARQ